MQHEPIRLLIIDDDEHIRLPLRDFLHREYRYEVECAADGVEALKTVAASNGAYDVLLIDQMLDGPFNGIQLMQQIKARHSETEAILFTGYAREHRQEALQSGAFLVVDKGQFERDELGMMVRNAAQQVRLRQIGRRILGAHDMESMLAMIAASATSLALADHAAIVLRDEDGWRICPALDRFPNAWSRHFRQESLTRRIMVDGAAVSVKDTRTDGRVAPDVVASNIRSFMGVPIPGAKGNLGALYVYSEQPRRFDDWGATTLLQTLADQVGLAIANVSALRERERAAAEFRTIYELGTKLSRSLHVDDVLRQVAESGRQLIGAERCTALLHEPHTDRFIQYGASVDPERFPAIIVEPRPDGYTRREILGSGVSYRATDLAQDPKPNPDVYATGVRSTLGVPMLVQGKAIGALFVHSYEPGAFSDHNCRLLEYLATYAGQALSNALRYQESAVRSRLLTALESALRSVRGEQETVKLEQEIARLAVEMLDCDFGGLCRNRASLEDLELIAAHNFADMPMPGLVAHGQGLIGSTAASGKAMVDNGYGHRTAKDPILAAMDVQALMTVPLVHGGDLEAVLFVGSASPGHAFTAQQEEVLRMYAEQAAISWQTSKLLGSDERSHLQLKFLHHISDFIQADEDLDRVLRVTLNGITAGYGLGFNRAALFLLNERRDQLLGRTGVGELTAEAAYAGWAQGRNDGTEQFQIYLERVKTGDLSVTELERRIPPLQMSMPDIGDSLFGQVLNKEHWLKVSDDADLARLPRSFVEAFEPALPLAIIALRARDTVIGLLVVDNKFSHTPITDADVEALKTFANTAAIAIDNTVLLARVKGAEAQLRALYAGSNTLLSSQAPREILDSVVEQLRWVAGADSVSVVRIDKGGNVRELVSRGEDDLPLRTEEVIRTETPDGYSMRVMASGEPIWYEDATKEQAQINPHTLERGIAAGLCLPFQLAGEPVGVIWLHYKQPRTFSQAQIDIYRLHASQAAVAYDSARRVEQRDSLRQAAETLAKETNVRTVLRRIVENAMEVLHASSAAVLSYDEDRQAFLEDYSVVAGVDEALWQRFVKRHASIGRTAQAIMKRGYIGVDNVHAYRDYPFLGETTRQLLDEIGVTCFQGVALQVGGSVMGVLFVNYQRPRYFDEEMRTMAVAFANHAALALQHAHFLARMTRARRAIQAVSQMSALEELGLTLRTIVDSVRRVLDCATVVLYPYHQGENRLGYPPTTSGVRQPDRVQSGGPVSAGSIIQRVIDTSDLYVAEDVHQDPILRQSKFVEREAIKSTVGVALHAHDRCVGVMLVGYRRPHRFNQDELDNIRHFGHQAAVAMHNAKLYDDLRRIKGYVGSSTAIEWMRMVSTTWGHTIKREVGKAQFEAELLRMDLKNGATPPGSLDDRLAKLNQILAQIGEIPILAPLSADSAVDSVAINELLQDCLTPAFAAKGRYGDIKLRLHLHPELDETVTIRASSAWIKRAFDIILENAVEAMRDHASPIKEMHVASAYREKKVILTFKDTGPGIPTLVREHLLKRPVPKGQGDRGAGIGLLQAQAIVQTYSGDIYPPESDENGTRITFWFPVEEVT